MYKSFHCFSDVPKSKASSTSGIKLELTSLLTTNTSIEPVFKLSMNAVPSMCRSFHCFADEPKS